MRDDRETRVSSRSVMTPALDPDPESDFHIFGDSVKSGIVTPLLNTHLVNVEPGISVCQHILYEPRNGEGAPGVAGIDVQNRRCLLHKYRVVHKVVHYLLLSYKQKFCHSISSLY